MPKTSIPEWRCPECGREYDSSVPGYAIPDAWSISDLAWNRFCPADGVAVVPVRTLDHFGNDALLGSTLDSRYAVFDILGLGGFGAVYRCYDVEANREVAVKTIRPGAEERTGADVRARFLQEARLLSELECPYIVKVHSFAETSAPQPMTITGLGEQKLLYMVMDLVLGPSLKRVLKKGGPIGIQRAATIAVQVLHALEYAHSLGLVHRDLKPGNILLVDKDADHIKVIDFGIAKVLEEADNEEGPKTGTGLVLGTVRYMAPEQLRDGGFIGPSCDLYSLGVLFYQMVTGNTPFDGSQAEMAAGHLYKDPPLLPKSVTEQCSVAATDLQRWLTKALQKEAEDRFEDATTMRVALQEVLPTMATEPHQMSTKLVGDTLRLDSKRIHNTLKFRTTEEGHPPAKIPGIDLRGTDPGPSKRLFDTRPMRETVMVSKPKGREDRTETQTLDDPETIELGDYKRRSDESTARGLAPLTGEPSRVRAPTMGQEAARGSKRNRHQGRKRDRTEMTDVPNLVTDPLYLDPRKGRKAKRDVPEREDGAGTDLPQGHRSTANRNQGEQQDTLLLQQMAKGIPSDGSSSIRTRGELGLAPRRERRISWMLPVSASGMIVLALVWLQPFAPPTTEKASQPAIAPLVEEVEPANPPQAAVETPLEMPKMVLEPEAVSPEGPPEQPEEPTSTPEPNLGEQSPPPSGLPVIEPPAPPPKKPQVKKQTKSKTKLRRRTLRRKDKRKGRKKRATSRKKPLVRRKASVTEKSASKASGPSAEEANRRVTSKLGRALKECRCEKATVILQGLPRAYPEEKRRLLENKVRQCRVPTVDEQCVDGKVQ